MSSSTASFDFKDSSSDESNNLVDHEYEELLDAGIDSILEGVKEEIQTLRAGHVLHTFRKRRRVIERNREEGHQQLINDYFEDHPTYTPEIFRRRFRMSKPLFIRIVDELSLNDQYFKQRYGGNGRCGFSPFQKCTDAIRILAYGSSSDSVDEYLRMSETSARDSLKHFVKAVIANFGQRYLRKPNDEDVRKLLHIGGVRCFPGMLGNIDCMHWEWKNCPSAWGGQYTGRSGKASIVLEAVASYDLWIWHAYFGVPGSQNDLNVLQRSPVFTDILRDTAPPVRFVVNNNVYKRGYYLADGIYPSWSTFVKTISNPHTHKDQLFSRRQESCRKDVERAFGVLQGRFAFVKRHCLLLDKHAMGEVLMACIIMHNMIVEDERLTYLNYKEILLEFEEEGETSQNDPSVFGRLNEESRAATGAQYLQNVSQIRDKATHLALRNDLVEHLWEKFPNERQLN